LLNSLDFITYFYLIFFHFLNLAAFTQNVSALNGLLCADVPLRNYALTHVHSDVGIYV